MSIQNSIVEKINKNSISRETVRDERTGSYPRGVEFVSVVVVKAKGQLQGFVTRAASRFDIDIVLLLGFVIYLYCFVWLSSSWNNYTYDREMITQARPRGA